MTYRISGKEVGDIGFGMMGLTFRPNPLSDEELFSAIKAALDSGCNYLNAGEFYGPPGNNSFDVLRRYYEKYPEDADRVVLNGEAGMLPNLSPSASRDAIATGLDNCLRALGPKGSIDIFEPTRKDSAVDYVTETLATINEYVEAGKIGGLACSEVNSTTLRQAAKSFDVKSLELELSLFRTEPLTNGLLKTCAELDIVVLASSPLGRGFLGGQCRKPEDIPERDSRRMYPQYNGDNFHANMKLVEMVEALAKKKGCTPSQIAINWLLAVSKRPDMPKIIPIPGSSNPARIRENATKINLSDADLAEIDVMLANFTPAGERYPHPAMAHLERE